MFVFCVIALLIVFYATGWRFNNSSRSFNQVGALFISSTPSESEIYLDNKLLDVKTPSTVNDLLPNEYAIRITRAGYNNWDSTIRIGSSTLVRLSDIYLIKKVEVPTKIIDGTFNTIYQLPNNRLAVFDGKTIVIVRMEDEKIIFQHAFNQAPIDLISRQNSNDFILKDESNLFFYVNPETNELYSLNEKYGIVPQWVTWETASDTTVMYADTNKTYSLKLTGQPKEFLPVQTLYSNGSISIIEKDNTLAIVKNGNTINTISSISSLKTHVKELTPSTLYISSASTGSGYFYLLPGNVFIRWDHAFLNAHVNSKTQQALIMNSTEIWQLNLHDKSERLINRSSIEIGAADWLLSNQFIYFQDTNGRMQIVGLGNNGANAYQIPVADALQSINFEAFQKIAVLSPNGIFILNY